MTAIKIGQLANEQIVEKLKSQFGDASHGGFVIGGHISPQGEQIVSVNENPAAIEPPLPSSVLGHRVRYVRGMEC